MGSTGGPRRASRQLPNCGIKGAVPHCAAAAPRRLCRLNESRLRLARSPRLGRCLRADHGLLCVMAAALHRPLVGPARRVVNGFGHGPPASRCRGAAQPPQPREPRKRLLGLGERNRFRPSARFSMENFPNFQKKSPGRRVDGPHHRRHLRKSKQSCGRRLTNGNRIARSQTSAHGISGPTSHNDAVGL
jgi:hypothetical protein